MAGKKTSKQRLNLSPAPFLTGLAAGAGSGLLLVKLVRVFQGVLGQPRFLSRAIFSFLDATLTLEEQALYIARRNLLEGIESRRLPDGQVKKVLVAGPRNFREPWARDFGFASFGLLAEGEYDVVRECLEVFFAYQKPDGQFPIKIHSTGVASRYLHSLFQREQPVRSPLRPKYVSGHNTVSLDGNGLLVVAALEYARAARDSQFLETHWDELRQAVNWLGSHAHGADGLLHQGAYSDWADSIARQGRVLYTNVIYWKALKDLAEAASQYGSAQDLAYLRAKQSQVFDGIHEHFWKPDLGYFVTTQSFDNLSSSGNLMAIAWGLTTLEQSNKILNAMAAYGMADPVPTRPVHRPYPMRYVAFENRLGGIPHYHTDAAWLWLGAWHVIALICQHRVEEAAELLKRMATVIVRDGEVHEVYGRDGNYLSTFWYTSEAPLTWSAGMMVYAYRTFHEHVLSGDQRSSPLH